MEPLDQLLKKSIGSLGLESLYMVSELAEKWQDIVGVQLAKKTTPLAVKDKVLLVRTSNSGWSHQLTLLKPVILERLKAMEYTIRDLRFVCKEEVEENPRPALKTVSKTKSMGPETIHGKPKLAEAIDSYLRAQKHGPKNGSNA